ncbi:MazG nucleotide pyrophosphohydrolase domain-containing protein [Deinococcus lacus]|uniref:MazG nucleotide pyrophosphohydrolase domain-containing protein n=1 Tax=Deinococcus lacus TaxID=392561 RepID=A0ABW1YAK3_9DEIO
MQELLTVMRRLRGPGGCPWDQEQTYETLRPYLLEEAAEAIDAATPAELCAELGDVLLQVAFHAVIAEEEGSFSYTEIERGVVDKMVRRHPHVFGDQAGIDSSADVTRLWQDIKARERGGQPRPLQDQIPAALGALERERQAQKRLRGQPALDPDQARRALKEALDTADHDEAGVVAVLQAAVAWAQAAGVSPELALRSATNAQLRGQQP